MKSRRFVLRTGLSLTMVLLLGCNRESAIAPAISSPAISSPATASPIAPPLAQTAPIELRGSFVDGEHPTRGMVQITTQGDRILELDEAFATSTSGPDLFVILHRSPDVIGSTTPPAYPIQEGDYVVLAPLRSYTGAQTYEIPDNINLDEFRSVAIWCRRFNATFGAATLEPQG